MADQEFLRQRASQEAYKSKVDPELHEVLYGQEYRGVNGPLPSKIELTEPFDLPPAIQRSLSKHLAELIGIDEVEKIPLRIRQ